MSQLDKLRDHYLTTKDLVHFAAWLAAKQQVRQLTRDEREWIELHGAPFGLMIGESPHG